MNVQLKVLIVLILPAVKCETLNDDLEDNTNKQKNPFDDDRFNKDLDDEEWHVAHLRQGRRHCVGDTFQDRARRYRKALQNDGALVTFVSSDPIPFNISEILEDETCKVDLKDPKVSHKHKKATPLTNTEVKASVVTETHTVNNTQNSSAVEKASNATSTVSRTDNYQATTPTMKVTDEEDDEKEQNSKSRRGSEYMFSSIEYYDETPDFDVSICPDAVDVIVLELDEIRSYDIECERIIEWRSLID